MTDRVPLVGRLTVPGVGRTDLEQAVTAITAEYSLGQVAELAVTVADREAVLPSSGLLGALAGFAGARWQVGAVDGVEAEWGRSLVLRCREPIAKQLRKTYRTGAARNVDPATWITARAREAGGTAVVQAGAKRSTIEQDKDATVLDALEALAGDLGWSWAAHDGVLYAGSRWSFWKAQTGSLPRWSVTWMRSEPSDAVGLSWFLSDDNTDSAGELELQVPYEVGASWRPLHRVQVSGSGAAGTWLVESVSVTHDGVSPVDVRCTIPRPPRGKAGSTGA